MSGGDEVLWAVASLYTFVALAALAGAVILAGVTAITMIGGFLRGLRRDKDDDE